MKYKTLLLLAITILAMGIVTFFTACPEATGTTGKTSSKAVEDKEDPTTSKGKTPTPPKYWHVSTFATGFEKPQGITITPDGSMLYVADTGNNQIKKITIAKDGKGTVSTIAGDGHPGNKDSETDTEAQFHSPNGVALAKDGKSLYVIDTAIERDGKPYSLIRKITLSDNSVTTIVKKLVVPPNGVALAKDGKSLYVTSIYDRHHIKKISLVAPHNVNPFVPGVFGDPHGIAVSPDGTALYFTDNNSRIRKIAIAKDGKGTVSTIADTGFKNPIGITITPDGNILYVADTENHQIKKITLSDNSVTIIAGSGFDGKANGRGTKAQFNFPQGIVAVSDTLLYVVDKVNNSIRKLEYKEAEKAVE